MNIFEHICLYSHIRRPSFRHKDYFLRRGKRGRAMSTMKAIKIHQYGGPEVLTFEECPLTQPGPGQARIKVEAAGVNFIDIYQRTGLYKNTLPHSLGLEGAGIVDALGPDAEKALLKVGDRVAWTYTSGSYATHVLVPYDRLVFIPEKVSFQQAAALMLQGMTAHYLTHSTYPLTYSDTCLVHAAAGGVGLLLCQMAKLKGARVIGTVSSEEKAKLAKEAGAHDVILYNKQDFVSEVKRITDGKGVNVVYDSVGKDTFEKDLDCLATRGMLVSFGQSSGSVPPFEISQLAAKGSLYLTRPKLPDYIETQADLLRRSADVMGWVSSGKLRLKIDRTYPLNQAAEAHKALEGRQTTGKVLLIP